MLRDEKGMTTLELLVTIIVIFVLAAAAIFLSMGEEGISIFDKNELLNSVNTINETNTNNAANEVTDDNSNVETNVVNNENVLNEEVTEN